jgi:phenylacetate-coenzyme A ligase PaaK-like adenylate-forming protein
MVANAGTIGLMGSIRYRDEIEEEQSKRLRRMLQAVLPANEFYRKKLLPKGITYAKSVDELAQLPFTTKGELIEAIEAVLRGDRYLHSSVTGTMPMPSLLFH